MSLTLITNDRSFRINVQSKPSFVGGQGQVYGLRLPKYGDCVLKIYKSQEKADKIRDKILYMMQQKPPHVNDNIQFCWPIGAVFDTDSHIFKGYVMLKAFPESRDLTILEAYSPKETIAQLFPDDTKWHNKFELKSLSGLKNRLKILYNWVVAIESIHATGKYIMGDIKPENVLVTPTGKISIIDIDSCQICDNGKIKFECDAKTPNYFPAEAYNMSKRHIPLSYQCDSFAIGCCIYSILIGCHPFTNIRLLPPYNNGNYSTISSRIKANLYYRGSNSKHVERIPALDLHANLDRLSPQLIDLFDRCFTGHTNRPTMTEWRNALKYQIYH